MIRLLYFFMALFSAAVIDLRKRIVPNWMVCLVALISIVPRDGPGLMGILAALPLFLAGITIGGIGGGDVKLVGACGLVLGLYQTVIGLILALSLLILWHIVRTVTTGRKEKQAYPLVPFLLLGMFISVLTGG